MNASEFIIELRMGIALLGTQAVEGALKRMIAGLLPNGEDFDAESYRANIEKDAKTPLGPLIKKLSEKTAVAPEFEVQLNNFLVMRNKFIHHFLDQPGIDLGTQSGREAAESFLIEYERVLQPISDNLAAVSIAVRKQYGLGSSEFENDEWYRRAERDFLPKVAKTFSKKERS
ncbi:MAG: hypothetical protein KKA05_05610 [Alphaproteobacteria bacterium]|nr:hypothetical protein [Alphaproteobacteria bacterium]